MANQFPKEIRIVFDQALQAYQDATVMARNVSVYQTNAQEMERSNNQIWRRMPNIAQSFNGSDATTSFVPQAELVVPASLAYRKHSAWVLSDTELRDALQNGVFEKAARQKLASDVNLSISDVAALEGTLVVPRTGAATGFDDVAQADAIMNEQGIVYEDRILALNTRDSNNMASNLQVASRSFDNDKSVSAYERTRVGMVANFETFKLDYANTLTAAAGGAGITISTLDAGGNVYTPTSLTVGVGGQQSPTDNRYQLVTVSSTTNVAVGDSFTIATLNAVHHVTKRTTGRLKTFRVMGIASATTMVISPPIITNQVPNDASAQYQNCTIGTKAANSAIVFLNTVTAQVNPFWHREAIELLPGTLVVDRNAGVQVMQGSTDQGLQLTLQRQWDIKTSKELVRLDAFWGVAMLQPEMAGYLQFGQT
jgi:hypothetical protein